MHNGRALEQSRPLGDSYHGYDPDLSPLPYVAQKNGQDSVIMEADTLTIADGGTWSESTTLQVTTNGQNATQTSVDSGTWVRANPP